MVRLLLFALFPIHVIDRADAIEAVQNRITALQPHRAAFVSSGQLTFEGLARVLLSVAWIKVVEDTRAPISPSRATAASPPCRRSICTTSRTRRRSVADCSACSGGTGCPALWSSRREGCTGRRWGPWLVVELGPSQRFSTSAVVTSFVPISVRCTGQRFAITSRRSRWVVSRSPKRRMSRWM